MSVLAVAAHYDSRRLAVSVAADAAAVYGRDEVDHEPAAVAAAERIEVAAAAFAAASFVGSTYFAAESNVAAFLLLLVVRLNFLSLCFVLELGVLLTVRTAELAILFADSTC